MNPGDLASQSPFTSDERRSASPLARPATPVSEQSTSPTQLIPNNSAHNLVAPTVDEDEADVDVVASFAQKSQESLHNKVEATKANLPSTNGVETFPGDDAGRKMESEASLQELDKVEVRSLEQGHGAEEEVTDTLRVEERREQQSLLAEINDQGQNEEMDVAQTPSSCGAAQDSQRIHVDYFLDEPPSLLAECLEDFMSDRDNYLKGCKWSPDGLCLLSCSNDNKLRLFNLPPEANTPEENTTGLATEPQSMKAVISVSEGELVYDYCWFPLMSSYSPETCCFATTSRGAPVHLWDAYDGHLRCSYVSYNHLDEVASAYSVAMSVDGTQLYCGFKNCIRVFDVCRPGRDFVTKQVYSRKNGGQNGIVSCIGMNPEHAGMFALGSYSGTVGVYSIGVPNALLLFTGSRGGVTHLAFSPCGTYLVTGERKSHEMSCYDVRCTGKLLWQTERVVDTNQRIYFDISSSGQYLASGSTNGYALFWDLFKEETKSEADSVRNALAKWKIHGSAVNGCSLHPYLPLLATSSGQWTFSNPLEDSDPDSDGGSWDDDCFENSLKIWSLRFPRT